MIAIWGLVSFLEVGKGVGAVEIAGDSEKNRRECVEVGNVFFGVGDCRLFAELMSVLCYQQLLRKRDFV